MSGAGAGPFGSMDFVGLNVIRDSMNNRKGEAPPFPVDEVIEYLRPYIEKGELGMKSGKGFHTYPNPNPAYRQPDFLKGD
jgi:3-hydroxyacyl-CoA dehydrogenase